VTADDILSRLGAEKTLRTLHSESDQRWEGAPVPLRARRLLPAFPVDAFPDWIATQVAAVAEFTQTPSDLAGCIALAALSTAAGGKAEVQVRPGWTEPVNLYTAVAMPPGSRKSAVFSAMTAPLLNAEAHLQQLASPRIAEAEIALKCAQRDAQRSNQTAVDAVDHQARAEAINQATTDALAVEELHIPRPPRLVADDVTTEAAASLMADHGGRIAVLSAEGGIFSILAGRYTGGAPSLNVFLKGHAGDMLRVDRKGRAEEHIAKPALTLGLAIQPTLLRDIAAIPGFRDLGLLARILYSLPENTVGYRKSRVTPLDPTVTDTYDRDLGALVRTLADHDEPALLELTAEGDDAVHDLQAAIEPKLAPLGELGHVADWASKLTGAVVRIAGLLHLATQLRDGWQQPISAATVHTAARLGTYFTSHALAVFDHMGADPTVDAAQYLLDWIADHHWTEFTKRDLFTNVSRARFRKVADLDPVLQLVIDHGWIRPGEPPASTGGRRPSPRYEVHPATQTSKPS
jgi:hypothetical protein